MSEIRETTELAAGPASVSRGEVERPADLKDHYVERLRRLLQLRSEHLGDLNHDGLWLLDRCIFATYCDCLEVGASPAAQAALRSNPSPNGKNGALTRTLRRSRRS